MNSFRSLARPPSLILPHKGGGDRLRPIAPPIAPVMLYVRRKSRYAHQR